MADSIKMLKKEIAQLEAELDRRRRALAILEPGNGTGAVFQGIQEGIQAVIGDTKETASGGERRTVAYMAERALHRQGAAMTPKEIKGMILEMFDEDVNDGTLASILWRGASEGDTFMQTERRGHYGLLEWDPGPKGKSGDQTTEQKEGEPLF